MELKIDALDKISTSNVHMKQDLAVAKLTSDSSPVKADMKSVFGFHLKKDCI